EMAGPVSGRRISRRTVRNIIIVVVVVTGLLAAFFTVSHFLNVRAEKTKETALAELQASANLIAEKISGPLSEVISHLNRMSASQEIVSLFVAADQEALKTQAEALGKSI